MLIFSSPGLIPWCSDWFTNDEYNLKAKSGSSREITFTFIFANTQPGRYTVYIQLLFKCIAH